VKCQEEQEHYTTNYFFLLSALSHICLSVSQPCQNAHSFALDVVDSLVHCGVLVMEEVRHLH